MSPNSLVETKKAVKKKVIKLPKWLVFNTPGVAPRGPPKPTGPYTTYSIPFSGEY
jgi:hypothetical protein